MEAALDVGVGQALGRPSSGAQQGSAGLTLRDGLLPLSPWIPPLFLSRWALVRTALFRRQALAEARALLREARLPAVRRD